MNKKSKKFNQQNTIFVKRGHSSFVFPQLYLEKSKECPHFTTPEFCPVTVLLPESFNTFGILPLRPLFSFFEKKRFLLLPSYRLLY